ncbi:MAG: integrase family protein [Methyloceanibacter sp.]
MTFTEQSVKALKPDPNGRQVPYTDASNPRLVLVVSPGGTKSWRGLVYKDGKQLRVGLGRWPDVSVKQANKKAGDYARDPDAASKRAEAGTFKEVAEQFVARYVDKNGLRSKGEMQRHLKYAADYWRRKKFLDLKRRDVSELLDRLEDNHSPHVADHVLATVRKLMAWYQTRDDDYVSPVVSGMRRGPNPKDTARKRVLTDGEVRDLWKLDGTFADFAKTLLLTGQRRDKVAKMRWSDLNADGVWTLPTEKREKGNAGELLLPQPVLDLIYRQPKVAGCLYVFSTGRRGSHLAGFSKLMKSLRSKLPPPKKGAETWTLHDLRRSARSLLSRAGVTPHVSERVLGHAMPLVEGTYDLYKYQLEKGEALEKLATLVGNLVTPDTRSKVVRSPKFRQSPAA